MIASPASYDWPNVKAHPAAELYPLMSEAKYAELERRIKLHGQREPIVMYEGAVLDGRHRLRACLATGAVPRYVEWKSKGENDTPWEFAWDSNEVHRGNMTETQRAAVRAKGMIDSDEWLARESSKRDEANKSRSERVKAFRGGDQDVTHLSDDLKQRPNVSLAARELSEKAGASMATAQRISVVAKRNPAMLEKIISGETSAKSAYDSVKKPRKNDEDDVPDSAPQMGKVIEMFSAPSNEQVGGSSLLREVLDELAPRLATLQANVRKVRLESKKLLELVARNGNSAKGFRYLGTVHRYLKEADENMPNAVPVGVCPACSGHEPYCKETACGGWISASESTSVVKKAGAKK